MRRLRETSQLTPLRRGAYSPSGPQLSDPRVLHEARVRAAAQAMSDQAVVSHVSAAVLHGLRALASRPRPRPRHARPRPRRPLGADVHVPPAPLDAEEVVLARRRGGDLRRTHAGRPAAWRRLRAGRRRRRRGPAQRGVSRRRVCAWRSAGRAGGPASRAPVGSRPSPTRAARASASPAAGWPSPASACRRRGRSSRSWTTGRRGRTVRLRLGGARRTVGEFDGKVKYGRTLRPGPGPWRRRVRREGARGRPARRGLGGRPLGVGRAGATSVRRRPDPACARRADGAAAR